MKSRIFVHRILIEGVKYHADKPNMIGKTFLRLERDFDKHVAYCRDEPYAQEFLEEREEVRNYFMVSRHLCCIHIHNEEYRMHEKGGLLS